MFTDQITIILSKFSIQSENSQLSSDFKSNPDIYSSDSLLPEIHLVSNKPFDKNICFFNIQLTTKLKENIFPKQQFKIPSITLPKLPKVIEKIKLNDLFGSVKKTSIDVFADNFNLDNIEESILRQKIKEIISKGKITPYEKKFTSEALMQKREWYLLGMRTFGPYQDKEIFVFLKKYCNTQHPPGTKFMIWEAINDIFYTPETCYDEITKLYGLTTGKEDDFMFNQSMRMHSTDFEVMKNNIRMNEQEYSMSQTNPNFKIRMPFRRFTKDLNGLNLGLSFKGNFGFTSNQANFVRSNYRKQSYQMKHYSSILEKPKIPEDKVVKEIVFDPFSEEDEIDQQHKEQEEENVKTIDVDSLFA